MPLTPANPDAGALFESYHHSIRRYILRMVRDAGEAEDLAQETFLRAHQRGECLRDPQAVAGWLYRIATNVCVDRLRAKHPEVPLESDEGLRPRPANTRVLSVADMAERAETSRCVQRCLEYLPDTYRAVLLMYEGHSLTAPEIANLLGLKLTTVKMRLHRAHVMLREVMRCGCLVSSDGEGRPVCQPKARGRSAR